MYHKLEESSSIHPNTYCLVLPITLLLCFCFFTYQSLHLSIHLLYHLILYAFQINSVTFPLKTSLSKVDYLVAIFSFEMNFIYNEMHKS